MYESKQIGARLREERKKKDLTQSNLAEYLHLSSESRQTISKYEKGERLPTVEVLIELLRLFECEAGYLLCEYNCKTKDVDNITAKTGLSEKAVNKIVILNKSSISDVIITLSKIIENDNFEKLLRAVHIHVTNFNSNRFNYNTADKREVAKYMECSIAEVDDYMKESSKALIKSIFEQIVSEIG